MPPNADRPTNLPATITARELLDAANHARELQKALQGLKDSPALLNSVNQYRELIQAVSHGKAMREALAAIDSVRTIREAMIALNPGKTIQEAMAAFDSNVAPNLAATFKAINKLDLSPVVNVARQMNEAFEAFRELSRGPLAEFSRDLVSMQRQIRETLAANQKPIQDFAETLRAASRIEWPAIHDFPGAGVTVTPDGKVVAGNVSVSLSEVQAVVEQVLERANIKSEQRAEEQIRRIIEEAKKLKQPLLQQVVLYVLLPVLFLILAAILNPIADYYVKESLIKDKRSVKKAINNEVMERLDRDTLRVFRMVTATALHVREKPSSTSAVVSTLHFGQAVHLLGKDENNKSWARIRWTNEDGSVSVEGWVFARYLEKFK